MSAWSERCRAASQLHRQGQLEEAAQAFRDLLRPVETQGVSDAEHASALLDFAAVLHALREVDEARAIVARAQALGNEAAERGARYLLARWDLDFSDRDANALDELQDLAYESIDDEPGVSALIVLAEVQRRRGQFRVCASFLSAAVGSRVTELARAAAAILATKIAAEDRDLAIGALRGAMDKGDRTTSVRAARYLGSLLAQDGRLQEAVGPLSLATTSEHADTSASAAVELGEVHLLLGNRPLARAALFHAIETGVPESSTMARRILFLTGLSVDGWDIGLSADVAAILRRRAATDSGNVHERAALARQAAALVENVDAPLAGVLWTEGAQLSPEQLPPRERLDAIRTAADSALRAVRIEEGLFGDADPRTAASHWRLARARGIQRDIDPNLDVTKAIPIQERGLRALTAAAALGGDSSQIPKVKNNLAMLYMSRRPEPTPSDLARSVELLQEALEGHRQSHGDTHGLFFNTLGNLVATQSRLQTKDQAQARESIVLAEEALQRAREEGVARHQLLPLIMALGTLYLEYEGGDQGANAGRAIELGEEALEISDAHYGQESESGIRVRNNLGNAYRWDPGSPVRAIAVLEDALAIAATIWGPDGAPVRVQLLDSLANAYAQAAAERDGPPGALERPLELHSSAVQDARTWFGDSDPRVADVLMDHAITLFHVGVARQKDEAILLLEEAIGIRRVAGGSDFELANLHLLLAVAHLESTSNDVESALRAASEALHVFTASTAPGRVLGLAAMLGNRLGNSGRWEEAAHFFATAQASALALQESSVLMRSHSDDTFTAGDTALAGAFAHTMAGLDTDALLCLERHRARWLRDALLRDRADLGLLESIAPEVAQRFRAATKTLQSLRRHELSSTGNITRPAPQRSDEPAIAGPVSQRLYRAAAAAQRTFQNALADVRAIQGFVEFLAPATCAQLTQALAPGWPAVYLAPAPWGTVILILWPDGCVHSFRAPVTHAHVAELLAGKQVGSSPIREGYVLGQLGDHSALRRALTAARELLAEDLLAPLADQLREGEAEGVVMVPCGGLATLPLQGLAYEDGGRCLLDDLDVVFAPSVQILRELSRRQSSVPQASARFVGVADPTHDLRFASLEVHGIARRFEAPMILPTEADRETVLSAIEEADFVHLACHARYQPEELLDSYFLLGAGEQLTLRDLLSGRAELRLSLFVASACQSAMTARHPDEALTLAGAFIHAGAATAIGALWSVNDLSTALLMSRFYELADTGRGGLPPWTALRKAQLWLRDAEPAALARPLRYMMESNPALPSTEKNNSREARGGHFADPYWWSPFICTGAPQSAISPEPDQ